MELFSIIFAIIVSFCTYGACLYGLDQLWIKPHHSEIPRPANEYAHAHGSPRKKIAVEELIRVKSLQELLEVYMPLIMNLDSEYWIHNIGLDGYTYLFFQRELIKMLLVFGIVSFVTMIPVSIWFADIKLKETESESDGEYLKYYQQMHSVIVSIMTCFFSLYAIYILFEVKNHVKVRIKENVFAKTQRNDYETLKARSVHVRGVYPEDRKGIMLHSGISNFLEMTGGGSIVSMIIVPDFVRIIELEGDRKRVDNAYKLLLANEPAVRRIFFPKKFRQEDYYEKKLNSIDDKIEQELMKPVTCSGHAFICFDSLKTRDHCLEYFKENEYKTWKDLWDKVASKEVLVPTKRPMLKRKFTSTFQQVDDEDLVRSLQDKELKIVMNRLERPFDLFWSNMGGARARGVVINLLTFLALIFLSTPTALSSMLQKIPIFKYFDFSQYVPQTEFGTFLKQISLPVWIIVLNQLLIFLIDYAAFQEKHRSFTLCQMSIFSKSLFYQTFNMFLIPALTLVTTGDKSISHFTSLFTLFKGLLFEGNSLAVILRQLYSSSAGNFFIIVLFQNAGFSSGFSFLRLGEIFNAFGSTWLAHYQRTCINDQDRWRKKESDVFKYGYLSAQIVVAFAIVISYTATTPGILLAGISFLLMRYSADGFNLLTIYKMEIDSDGQMIQTVLKYMAGACLLPQFAMAVSYFKSGYYISSGLIGVLMLATIYLCYEISKPIIADEKELLDVSQEMAEVTDYNDQLHKWESVYKHPLLVGPAEVSVSRGERTVSYILQ